MGDAKLKDLYREKKWLDTVLFLVIGALFMLGLQQLLLKGLSLYGEGNLGIMNRVIRGQIDADILISGSSRAMYHYDPRIIENKTKLNTFNIGRNGTKLHEQLQLLKLYLLYNKKPVFLIQNLDIISLEKNDDITDPKQYIPWLNNAKVYNPLFQQKTYYLLYRWCPLFAIARTGGMQAAVLGLLKQRNALADECKGYNPQYLTWNEDFDKFRLHNPIGIKLIVDPLKIQSLEDLLQICKKNNISIILVYSPEYIKTQEVFRNRDEIIQAFREIAIKFQVPFWDHSDDPICGNTKYFYNSQHLNHLGASVFSESIASQLVIEISKKQKDAVNSLYTTLDIRSDKHYR